jgi:hypothetical protein
MGRSASEQSRFARDRVIKGFDRAAFSETLRPIANQSSARAPVTMNRNSELERPA